jgi:hypothetical protein
MSRVVSWADEARRILRDNDTGSFIKPSPKQYPHQWNWDAALIAVGLATFDIPRAQAEVRKLLEGQWQDGMVPHILYFDGPSDYFPTPDFWGIERSPNAPAVQTSGLTQPPVLATAVRAIYERDADKTAALGFVHAVYPKLLAWHRWFHSARDPEETGLVAIIHPWESGMDNSTRWTEALARIPLTAVPEYERRDRQHVAADERPVAGDYDRFMTLIHHYREAAWDADRLYQTAPFCVQDTFTSAILGRADEDLRFLAELVDEPTAEIDNWLGRTRSAFGTRLWNEEAGLYYDFDLRAGQQVRENTCATFMPLYAGLASEAQAARLVETHLLNPDEYTPDDTTRYFLPSAAKNSPYFEPRRYWRGPVWLNINWLVIQGLRRYGYAEVADTITAHTLELIERGGFAEYYDPRDGTPCGAREFSWSAALMLELLG